MVNHHLRYRWHRVECKVAVIDKIKKILNSLIHFGLVSSIATRRKVLRGYKRDSLVQIYYHNNFVESDGRL
jgi:hypothetical protein